MNARAICTGNMATATNWFGWQNRSSDAAGQLVPPDGRFCVKKYRYSLAFPYLQNYSSVRSVTICGRKREEGTLIGVSVRFCFVSIALPNTVSTVNRSRFFLSQRSAALWPTASIVHSHRYFDPALNNRKSENLKC
jgi:hypothetical protein